MKRWKIVGRSVVWDVTSGDEHTDFIEESSFGVSDIVTYGMESGRMALSHHLTFPSLRIRPNDTCGSYCVESDNASRHKLCIDGVEVHERLCRVTIDGILTLLCADEESGIQTETSLFPAKNEKAFCEEVTVRNVSGTPKKLTLEGAEAELDHTVGPMGICIACRTTDFAPVTLDAGEEYTFSVVYSARLANKPVPEIDVSAEKAARVDTVKRLTSVMELDTGNKTIDTLFYFSKLRAGESVFDTKFGRIHCPGGGPYYAATWCNDQVEYSGPYFAYTGDDVLIDAGMNAYRMYMPFMSDKYLPIPCSVIAEGLDFWSCGDRGDAEMYLYGASRFALAAGDEKLARELLPAIEWCAEYTNRQKMQSGVIHSDTDELERRFPTGDANLSTSCLAYDGYRSAAVLERDFGSEELADEYDKRADELKEAIEAHFGYNIHGFDTYRYYEGCEVLRSWICMPLCVGIFDRAAETAKALTSEYIMTEKGTKTSEEKDTLWDRSTLYTLRGLFAAGEREKATNVLNRYSEIRLLGDHVPYAVEAYPEGKGRHLSAESALYCKVVTEGMLDFAPKGLEKFTLKPVLPVGCDHLYLRNVTACGMNFDVLVEKDGFRVVSRDDDTVLASGGIGERVTVCGKNK